VSGGDGIGPMIRRARRAHGWSQTRLAEELNAASGRCTSTRQDVYRWETGRRVPVFWLPFLARVLGIPRRTLERATAGTAPPGPASPLAELLPAETDPLLPLATARTGHRIGERTVEDLTGRVHGLRLADDVLAGGDLIGPAFRELRAAVRLYQESTHTERIGNALLTAIGELAQIAGWIASDAGRHGQAEQAYRLGISAARQAHDTTLAGNLMGSLAYQHANTQRPADAVTMATEAARVTGDRAPARARALALDRLAWAHTKADHPQDTIRALGQAREALDTHHDGTEEPGYLYWVNDEELQIMEARCHTELHRPLRAVPLLSAVLDRYDASRARELGLYLSWLAVAYADANEPEAAAGTAERMITVSGDVPSDRLTTRTRTVLDRLRPFTTTPEVRDLLDRTRTTGEQDRSQG